MGGSPPLEAISTVSDDGNSTVTGDDHGAVTGDVKSAPGEASGIHYGR
jgi:hypothetical protein